MKKPNVVVVLIDDMGWRDLCCYGSDFYETPSIDVFAKRAVSFTNAYASCPVCSPSRASLQTGKYPACHKVTNLIGATATGKLIDAPYQWYMDTSEYTLAKALKDEGYDTWHIGKWHLGGEEYYPEKHGFDLNIGGCEWGYPAGGYFSPYKNPKMQDGPDGEYLSDRLTDEAISLIEKHDDTKPFYLNLCHYAVHIPLQAPAHLVEKYKTKKQRLGLDKINPFIEGDNFPTLRKRHMSIMRRIIQSDEQYAAMIENLDYNFGRLIDALEKKGQLDNTIVLFTSDNGGLSTSEGSPTCNAPLKEGKGWANEGGVRVPFILKMPGGMQGKASDEIVSQVDFYPTVLKAAGIELKEDILIDGADICDAMQGKHLSERPIYWHYPHYGNAGGTPHSAVRLGEWKLIEYFENGKTELFNVTNDISEENELSKQYPQKAEEMQRLLSEWRKKVNAIIPLANPDYKEGIKMKFSVLMSVYQKVNPEHLKSCINSLIEQTVKPAQIVIVKDDPLPETLQKVLDDFCTHNSDLFTIVTQEKNPGIGKAASAGLLHCRYELVAKMDSDDICRSDRFELQLKEFEKDGELALLGSTLLGFQDTIDNVVDIKAVPLELPDILKYAKQGDPFNKSTVMYKKQAVLNSRGYEDLLRCGDYDIYVHMLRKGYKAKNLKEGLVFYRLCEDA